MFRAVQILLLVTLTVISLGVATYFFTPVPATIYSLKEKATPPMGGGSSYKYRPIAGSGQSSQSSYYKVEYLYSYGNDSYTSGFVGFYFPTSSGHNSFLGQEGGLKAYVCPLFPRAAVLVPGFQLTLWLPLLALSILGLRYIPRPIRVPNPSFNGRRGTRRATTPKARSARR